MIFFVQVITYSFCAKSFAQNRLQYDIKIKSNNAAVVTPDIKRGTSVSPNGEGLGYTGNYLICNGKPWFPVMGNFIMKGIRPINGSRKLLL